MTFINMMQGYSDVYLQNRDRENRTKMSEIGIKELAKNLGISTASVSRALSNPGRVSAKMRERVRKAAKEVGYRPNKLGASLRTSRTRNIIVIIPDISDTFNSGVIRSLERTAAERGYSVLFGDTQGQREQELAYGDIVRSKQADGIICFSHRLPFKDEDIQAENFTLPPLVNSCESMSGGSALESSVPLVSIDNVAAGREVTEHLLSLGHKNIAVITGDLGSPSSQQRLEGYKQAIEAAGLPYREELIRNGEYTLEAGQECTEVVLLAKHRPTAIFCMCDEMALGCLYTLKENGFSVPEDMSVVGFDNIRFARFFSPALTTVAQPVDDIGRRCVEVLLDIIDGKDIENSNVILPHELIVRDSTASAPK
jgi:LacI family repressor for deo operon, udp, cdd, tsx, nupC, and nupG